MRERRSEREREREREGQKAREREREKKRERVREKGKVRESTYRMSGMCRDVATRHVSLMCLSRSLENQLCSNQI